MIKNENTLYSDIIKEIKIIENTGNFENEDKYDTWFTMLSNSFDAVSCEEGLEGEVMKGLLQKENFKNWIKKQ